MRADCRNSLISDRHRQSSATVGSDIDDIEEAVGLVDVTGIHHTRHTSTLLAQLLQWPLCRHRLLLELLRKWMRPLSSRRNSSTSWSRIVKGNSCSTTLVSFTSNTSIQYHYTPTPPPPGMAHPPNMFSWFDLLIREPEWIPRNFKLDARRSCTRCKRSGTACEYWLGDRRESCLRCVDKARCCAGGLRWTWAHLVFLLITSTGPREPHALDEPISSVLSTYHEDLRVLFDLSAGVPPALTEWNAAAAETE